MLHLNGLLVVAIAAFCTAPLYAWAQQPEPSDLKAEARNAVSTIGADRRKNQTYCQVLELERRQQADQEKNSNKKKKKDKDKEAAALSQKIIQLQKQVGPELVTLDNILKGLDLTSPDGREIALVIQSLNGSCPY